MRPLTENGFEIVFGARRYRAAQLAGQDTVPVRIRQMSDAEALEAQLVENLIRAEIHPMEEAQGFPALLDSGRTEVQHRADCGQAWQVARVRRFETQVDRPWSQSS